MLSTHLNKNVETLTMDFVDSVGGLVLINIREYRWREEMPAFENILFSDVQNDFMG